MKKERPDELVTGLLIISISGLQLEAVSAVLKMYRYCYRMEQTRYQ